MGYMHVAASQHATPTATMPRLMFNVIISFLPVTACMCWHWFGGRREVIELRMSDVPNAMQVEAVVGLHNNANERLNITAIMGSLNNAQAFHQYYQNFTYQVFPWFPGIPSFPWLASALSFTFHSCFSLALLRAFHLHEQLLSRNLTSCSMIMMSHNAYMKAEAQSLVLTWCWEREQRWEVGVDVTIFCMFRVQRVPHHPRKHFLTGRQPYDESLHFVKGPLFEGVVLVACSRSRPLWGLERRQQCHTTSRQMRASLPGSSRYVHLQSLGGPRLCSMMH